MDYHQEDELPGGGCPPRKVLQGPRPAPLRVRKESHKIKKPPVAPPPPAVQHQQPPPQPPRQPVIIYTVSPKVIHANPSEFMTLVQRLTGPDSMSSSSSSSTSSVIAGSSSSTTFALSGAISPAARYASIEKTKMPLEGKKLSGPSGVMEREVVEINGGGGLEGAERTVFFSGILSPGPGSLPPISPNLFSPFFVDPSNVNLHQGLTAVQHGMVSPFSANNFMVSPSTMFSPSSLDLLRHIMDG